VEIIGELANHMDAREWPKVIATFFDGNGAVLATEDALMESSCLAPGSRSPFSASTDQKNVASYTLRIKPGDPIRLRPPSVRITSQKSRQAEEKLIVRGSVHNDGDSDAEYVEVYVNIYDRAGHILDSDSAFVENPLKAGNAAPFEVSLDRPPDYHHYEVFVEPECSELPE
jgi:hypothetical protein